MAVFEGEALRAYLHLARGMPYVKSNTTPCRWRESNVPTSHVT